MHNLKEVRVVHKRKSDKMIKAGEGEKFFAFS